MTPPHASSELPADDIRLFDSHAHLDAREFDGDREAVLRSANKHGVAEILAPAVAASDWQALHEFCAAHPGVYPAYGLHPLFLARHKESDLHALESWLKGHRPHAVGECGLDFHDASLDRERQLHFLRAQLRLAHEFDLPLVLHARGAFERMIQELRRFIDAHGALRGVVHSFSGSAEQARQLWRIGFHIGIGGPVTYLRANRLRGIVASMPIEFLLLETDAPDQPGLAHRGQRNEPANLVDVLRCVADLRGETPSAVASATTANARGLFLRR